MQARPFLKWAGSKREVLPSLTPHFPRRVRTYVEPFLGGGSVALYVLSNLDPQRVVLCDRNPALISAYQVVRDDVEALIERLQVHGEAHGKEHYYQVRAQEPVGGLEAAARLIYLNKTCFNGLYRLNRKGRFNVPIGRQRQAAIVKPEWMRRVSALLQGVELRAVGFQEVIGPEATDLQLGEGDFVYLDPPYDPVSDTASFTSYDGIPFLLEDQQHLAEAARFVAAGGCRVVASNSDTPRVRDLYKGFTRHKIDVLRRISRKRDGRVRVGELVMVA